MPSTLCITLHNVAYNEEQARNEGGFEGLGQTP